LIHLRETTNQPRQEQTNQRKAAADPTNPNLQPIRTTTTATATEQIILQPKATHITPTHQP